jgi:hypothetical protein
MSSVRQRCSIKGKTDNTQQPWQAESAIELKANSASPVVQIEVKSIKLTAS